MSEKQRTPDDVARALVHVFTTPRCQTKDVEPADIPVTTFAAAEVSGGHTCRPTI